MHLCAIYGRWCNYLLLVISHSEISSYMLQYHGPRPGQGWAGTIGPIVGSDGGHTSVSFNALLSRNGSDFNQRKVYVIKLLTCHLQSVA